MVKTLAKGLLILRLDVMTSNEGLRLFRERIIEPQLSTGVLVIPPYVEPLVIPDDLEIKIEPRAVDEAISQLKDKFQKTEESQSES